MILRRVIQHVKHQDWAAIAIDLLIVVVGVFIGIQVANWNEHRNTQRKAAAFTERLKADLRDEAWGYEMQIGYYGQVLANARKAADALTGRARLSDEALVIAAYRATQYNANIRRRATYDEMTSTGELGLIGERALRQLAMDVYTSPVFDWVTDEGRMSRYRQEFRKVMPHAVQAAVSASCGDRIRVGDYAGIATSLADPCRVALAPAELAAAATVLRNDADILPLLRLRIADVETTVGDLGIYYAAMRAGLRDVAGKTK